MAFAEPDADCCNVFAHSRRRRILRLLHERPEIGRCFSDMQKATGYRAGPLLKHLRRMERTGMIARDGAGHTIAVPQGGIADVGPAGKPVRVRRVA